MKYEYCVVLELRTKPNMPSKAPYRIHYNLLAEAVTYLQLLTCLEKYSY